MNVSGTTPVFVYGTLKRRGANHRLLLGQRFISVARSGPGFTLYSLGDYPGMVRDPGDANGVEGELWEVDAPCLARLDQFEGVPEGLYERVRIRLAPPHGHLTAETYLYARDLTGHPVLGSCWEPPAAGAS